jgi:hypothetical protein
MKASKCICCSWRALSLPGMALLNNKNTNLKRRGTQGRRTCRSTASMSYTMTPLRNPTRDLSANCLPRCLVAQHLSQHSKCRHPLTQQTRLRSQDSNGGRPPPEFTASSGMFRKQ